MSETSNSDISFDIIDDILKTLRFRSSIFFHSELSAPWGVSFPSIGLPRFHIALSGSFVVGSNQEDCIDISQNGIALLPTGGEHWIADKADRKLTPSDDMVSACKLNNPFFKQGDITHDIMCGIVHYEQEMGHPIFDSLSEILSFTNHQPNDTTLALVNLIAQEIRAVKTTSNQIIDRLTEALFIKMITTHLNSKNNNIGFIGALHDSRVSLALSHMHQRPQLDWSVESLSEEVGMSTSTLTRHFKKHLHMAPMAYLTNWRMIKAHNLIKYTETDLEHIAETVGFGSARTLNRAFQRHYSYTPNELRKSTKLAQK